MSRYDEVMTLIPEEAEDLLRNTVEEIVFIEERLKELKKLPFIKVHPEYPELQKPTPAAKMYKELLQQYNNCIKLVESVIYRDKKLDNEEGEESPLRKWFRENKER